MQRLMRRKFRQFSNWRRGGSEDPAVIQTYFTSESKVAYSIVANNEEKPNAES
jgi:hypothetical protein